MVKRLKKIYMEASPPMRVSFWFIICAVIERGISFLTVPFFARALTTEEYGLVTLYHSWMGIVCIFTTLNLQYGSLGTAQMKFEDRKNAYVSSIQFLVTILSVIAILFAVFFAGFFETLFELPSFLIIVMVVECWAVFIIGLWKGNKRFDYKYKPIVVVTLIMAIISPVVSFLAVIESSHKAIARIVSLFLVQIIIAVVLFGNMLYKGKCLYNRIYWKFALSFNVPIIPYYLAQIIFGVSDRIIISRMEGQDKAGIYGLVYTVAFVLDFVRGALNSGYSPWYYRKIKAKDGIPVLKLNKRIMAGFLGMIVLFILFGPEAVYLMGGEEYYPARWIVPPIAVSLLFAVLVDNACYIEFYFEKKASLVKGTCMSAILNIVLNYLMIPKYGYMAASYTTLISYMIFWVYMTAEAGKTCKENGLEDKCFLNQFFQAKVAILGIIFIPIELILYNSDILRYCTCGIIFGVCILAHKKIGKWILECVE